MLAGKARFLVAGVLLVVLSLGYHFWLYPKLLQQLAPPQSLQDIEWQAESTVECEFGDKQQCILRAGSAGNNRFIGRIKGVESADSVAQYDLAMQLNPSVQNPNRGYKVVLISEQRGWRLWQKPHHFFRLNFMNSWFGQGRLYFQQPVEGFQLLVDIKGADASFVISDFKLVQAQETLWNRLVQATLILLWLGLFWIAVRWLWQTSNRWNYPLAVMLVVTLIGTQLPNASFAPIKNWIKEKHTEVQAHTVKNDSIPVNANTPKPQIQMSKVSEQNPIIMVKQFAHFGLFAFFTLFLWLRFQQVSKSLYWVISFVLLFAVATETLQSLGKVRSSSLTDVGIDMAGSFIMLLIMLMIRNRRVFSKACERRKG